MSVPSTDNTHHYQFTDDIRFFQKAVVIHPNEEKFLIIKRSEHDKIRPGTWDLPGGNIVYGELHIDGLRREILEEVGLEVSAIRIVHLITQYNTNIQMYYIVTGFKTKAKSDKVVLSHEHTEYKWVTKEVFLAMDQEYTFVEERPFDGNSTHFLRDIVYLAF